MIGFTLQFFTPMIFAHYGFWKSILVWMFGFEAKLDFGDHEYGFRLRLFGVMAGIDVHWPRWSANVSVLSENEAENSGISQEVARTRREMHAFAVENGAKIVIGSMELLNVTDRSFTLPGDMPPDLIELGDVVLFGNAESFMKTSVTGYRAVADGSTLYFCSAIQVAP